MITAKEITERLQDPFDSTDLEWRVQQCGISAKNAPWVMVVPYVTNRAIQQRLDDVVGIDHWRNEYQPSSDGKGYLCGLSIKFGMEWVTKWDGAQAGVTEKSKIDGLKAAMSNSMKRTAVQFGIGRYLYNLDTEFATAVLVDNRRGAKSNYQWYQDDKKVQYHIDWADPKLPEWALPQYDANQFVTDMSEADELTKLKFIFQDAYRYAKSFGRLELQDHFKATYDARVDQLDTMAKSLIKENFDKAQGWLDRQLDALSLIPEASSVEQVCKALTKTIIDDAVGQYYDEKLLLAQVKQAQADRIDQINNPETKEAK